MKISPQRVHGIGQCSLDYVTTVTSYPPEDSKCEFSDLVVDGGGPVATALVALSRWGVHCSFAGVVGDDDFGGRIRQLLQEEHVDCAGLRTRPQSTSQFAFAVAEPTSASRTIFWRRPTGPALSAKEVDADEIRRAGLLYTDGLFPGASLEAARLAQRAGVGVFVDGGTLREGMLDLARHTDVFLASETFSRQLVGEDNPAAACRRLAELGPHLVGVTLGRRGYLALSKQDWIRGEPHLVKALDTTGCGDAFHAGAAYGLLRGWAAVRCLDFGAWAAAQVATRLGGRRGLPDAGDYPGHAADSSAPPLLPEEDSQ